MVICMKCLGEIKGKPVVKRKGINTYNYHPKCAKKGKK